MTLFEFLMVHVSIVIGLGIAQTLTGVARVIQFWRRRGAGRFMSFSFFLGLLLFDIVKWTFVIGGD